MNKETFLELIELHKEQEERIDRLSEIIDYDSPVVEFGYKMFDKVLEEAFTEEQIDWINWWLYDRICFMTGKELPYWDENNNECYLHTAEELWDYIQNLK